MKPYNERLPLIDAAIDNFKGKMPSFYTKLYVKKDSTTKYCGTSEHDFDFVCTREEFEQRKAQWDKLYEWCVITDKVTFENFITSSSMKEWATACAERHGFNWQDTLEKRPEQWVVDNNEAPEVKFEMKAPSGLHKEQNMNNDWYEKGELPPVGAVCEYHHPRHGWKPVEIIGIHIGRLAFAMWGIDDSDSADYRYGACDKAGLFRPIPTETDKLVEQIADELRGCELSLTGEQLKIISKHLIEQGYRKTKPMSRDEIISKMYRMTDRLGMADAVILYDAGCRFIDKGE